MKNNQLSYISVIKNLVDIVTDDKNRYVNNDAFIILLDIAGNNKLLYPYLNNVSIDGIYNIKQHQILLEQCKKNAKKYTSTLINAKKTITNKFLVLKTYDSYPYQANDVDIIVNSENPLILRDGEYNLRKVTEFREYVLEFNNQYPVDIYIDISWGTANPWVDNDLLWSSPRKRLHDGKVDILLPSVDGDLATHLAHMAAKYSFNLAEFLHVCSFGKRCDIDVIINQTKKNNWYKHFIEIITNVNFLYRILFDSPSVYEEHFPFLKRSKMKFPFSISLPKSLMLMLTQQSIAHIMISIPELWKLNKKRNNKILNRILPISLESKYYKFIGDLV